MRVMYEKVCALVVLSDTLTQKPSKKPLQLLIHLGVEPVGWHAELVCGVLGPVGQG